jgi:hypothetical protein
MIVKMLGVRGLPARRSSIAGPSGRTEYSYGANGSPPKIHGNSFGVDMPKYGNILCFFKT